MIPRMLFYLLIIPVVSGITLLSGSTVRLNCAGATGVASCDWRCIDACSIPFGNTLDVETVRTCIRQIGASCQIPAEAEIALQPAWSCSTIAAMDNDDTDAQGYAFRLPETHSREVAGFNITHRSVNSLIVEVLGEFDRNACRTLIEYSVASSAKDLTAKPEGQCSRTINRGATVNTRASYGTNTLELNLTDWAVALETSPLDEIGRQAQTVELATLGGCWAEATNFTIFHTSRFNINSEGTNAVIRSLKIGAVAVLTSILMLK